MEVGTREGVQPLYLHLGGRAPGMRMVVGWDESMQKGMGRVWVLKMWGFLSICSFTNCLSW